MVPKADPSPPPLSLHHRQIAITLSLSAGKEKIKRDYLKDFSKSSSRIVFPYTPHVHIAHMLLVPFVGALIGIKTFELLPFSAENDALKTYISRNVIHSHKK